VSSSEESPKAVRENGRIQKLVAVKREQPARVRPETRNRNLLGRMQGYLASAKRQLSDEGPVLRVKEEPGARWEPEASPPPASADDASADRSDEEEAPAPPPRKRAKHAEPKLSAKERNRQQRAKQADADAKAEAKEMRALQGRLEDHYSSMKNFIRTRAEPTIFYLPAKLNGEAQRQLEETREAISQKIKSLKKHLRATAGGNDEQYDDSEDVE